MTMSVDQGLDLLLNACPDLAYLGVVYDWAIVTSGDDEEPETGAIGRCGALNRARAAVEEALDELPADQYAAGQVKRVNVFDPEQRRTVAVAVRVADRVHWSNP